ncbi:MAG: class I SAM-dependent methyltransferase [Acidimicrobiales bacterium]
MSSADREPLAPAVDAVVPHPGDGGDWTDPLVAGEWAKGDHMEAFLALPRRMTADVLALGSRPVRTIVDVGSGPGGFLSVLLDRLPDARGLWTDVSPAMQSLAAERLARFGGRVELQLLDAMQLDQVAAPGKVAAPGGVDAPGKVDAVVTSRVSHHLLPDQLLAFYRSADRLLGEWGWIANLDHVTLPQPWEDRLVAARTEVVPRNLSPHHHDGPRPTLADHLAALESLGDLDVVVAWQAYTTVLILAGRGT